MIKLIQGPEGGGLPRPQRETVAVLTPSGSLLALEEEGREHTVEMSGGLTAGGLGKGWREAGIRRMEVKGTGWRLGNRREGREEVQVRVGGRLGEQAGGSPRCPRPCLCSQTCPQHLEEALAHRRYLKIIWVRPRGRGKPLGAPCAFD